MTEWVDAEKVTAILGADLSADLDVDALEEACTAVRSYVEGKRSDLFVAGVDEEDEPTSTFTPTPSVVYGAAMLAYRWYSRRKSPLGVLGFTDDGASGILRDDPDIARQLGIGSYGRFVFGATPADVVEESA